MEAIKIVILVTLLLIGVCQDVRTGKIKNQLNLSGTCLGVICASFSGSAYLKSAFLGWLLSLFWGIVLYQLGMIKAGDAKFLWIIGVFKGPRHFGNALILGILVGGVMSLAFVLTKRDGKKRLQHLYLYFKLTLAVKKYTPYQAEKEEKFPFSLPLALGAVMDFWIQIF